MLARPTIEQKVVQCSVRYLSSMCLIYQTDQKEEGKIVATLSYQEIIPAPPCT